MTLAINGLGRMGRTILRLALQRGHTVKALNDIAKWDILSYLIEFDTTHGKFNGDINFDNNIIILETSNEHVNLNVNSLLPEVAFYYNTGYNICYSIDIYK